MVTLTGFILIAAILIPQILGGVYPNYHGHFDFVPLDAQQSLEKLNESKEWWQTASFYQIYPRSFKDSDGDGVGDLNGIAEKLPYLREIGINATWLSPIFKSPMADFGYDISDYKQIAPIFGTMADFEALLAKAKEIGIKIFLDFVPNHTSDESEWFIKSAASDPEYKDFYVWHPGKIIDGVRHPPSNWVSVFRGPAWEWHEGRQAYYFHQFLKKQPDLNYRNPKVQEAMKEVLRFWLRKGVSGFRIDAVPHLYEIAPDANGNYPDEPRNPYDNDPESYGYLQHIYTYDQPETINEVYAWRAVLDEFRKENDGDALVLMTECYSSIDIEMKYYGNATAEGAQIPFNFLLVSSLGIDSDAERYAELINTWMVNMPAGRTANWVIGNHDVHRVGTRLGEDRIDMLNMLVLTLPGCSVTYNGEEIGMTDVWISWEDTVDPAACNTNPDIYTSYSRDPERTPFQWDDSIDAGFSTANKTWLPLAKNYTDFNVKIERQQEFSHLNVYKKLQELREEATLRHGDAEIRAISKEILAIKRSLLNDRTYIILLNVFGNIETVDLTKSFKDLPDELVYVVVTSKSKNKVGDQVKTNKIELSPFEAIVLRSLTNYTTTAGYFAYYQSNNEIPRSVEERSNAIV